MNQWLSHPNDWRRAFRFPLQHSLAKKEITIGALWLLVPLIGWLLNMGHRIILVHQMQNGQSAWPAWGNYPALLRHGVYTFLGMLYYHAPAGLLIGLAWYYNWVYLYIPGGILALLATIAVPGYMSHYCKDLDPREIFDPFRALSRVRKGGKAYWAAWGIALRALFLSFGGLLLFGIGFLWTSVWFWQVAAYAFASVFTQSFALERSSEA